MAPADGTHPLHRRLSPSLAYDSPPLLAMMTGGPLCVNHGPRAAESPSSAARRRSSRELSRAPRPPLRWTWGQRLKAFLSLALLPCLSAPAPPPEGDYRAPEGLPFPLQWSVPEPA